MTLVSEDTYEDDDLHEYHEDDVIGYQVIKEVSAITFLINLSGLLRITRFDTAIRTGTLGTDHPVRPAFFP